MDGGWEATQTQSRATDSQCGESARSTLLGKSPLNPLLKISRRLMKKIGGDRSFALFGLERSPRNKFVFRPQLKSESFIAKPPDELQKPSMPSPAGRIFLPRTGLTSNANTGGSKMDFINVWMSRPMKIVAE